MAGLLQEKVDENERAFWYVSMPSLEEEEGRDVIAQMSCPNNCSMTVFDQPVLPISLVITWVLQILKSTENLRY